MLYFETFTGQSRIELYYHNTTDTSVFYLETDNSGTTANNFVHDYTTAAFDPALQDTSAGEAFTYVQAMGGVLTELHFPTLSTLVDSSFLITKAELVFHSEIGSDASGMWSPINCFSWRQERTIRAKCSSRTTASVLQQAWGECAARKFQRKTISIQHNPSYF